MGRDELSGKAEPGGFVEYDKSELPKVNTQRRDKTRPDFYGIPILTDAQVLFTTEKELGCHPASCYTCKEQTRDLTCERLGPAILVKKVTGTKDSGDQIEYWPCCSMHEWDGGEHQTGKPEYHDCLDTPESIGLIWINAPEPGLKFSGANCGGKNGGDDCDHYITYGKQEKWDTESAYCRVLAHDVGAGDVCAAWNDDDILWFHEATMLMRGESKYDDLMKKRMAKEIIGGSDDS